MVAHLGCVDYDFGHSIVLNCSAWADGNLAELAV